MNGYDLRIKVQILYAQIQAFKQTQPAAIQQLDGQIIRVGQLMNHPIHFLPR